MEEGAAHGLRPAVQTKAGGEAGFAVHFSAADAEEADDGAASPAPQEEEEDEHSL